MCVARKVCFRHRALCIVRFSSTTMDAVLEPSRLSAVDKDSRANGALSPSKAHHCSLLVRALQALFIILLNTLLLIAHSFLHTAHMDAPSESCWVLQRHLGRQPIAAHPCLKIMHRC